MKRKLKLGVIEVLNVLPVYYGIISGHIQIPCDVITGKVTELNNKLNRGEIDISVISSFEYAKNPDLYYILPDLSISADGPVRSIYLFLDKPLETLSRDVIKLTEFSLTSVHLIQYLLKEYPVSYTRQEVEDCSGELLIADEAIQRFYQRRDPFVYDLSELWRKKTGLPFVFALWAVRRDVFESYRDEVYQTHTALLQSKSDRGAMVDQIAVERFAGIFPDAESCAIYLKNLRYDLSSAYQEGYALFQQKLVELKKLPFVAPLEFIPNA